VTHRRQALNPDTTEAPASAFAASAAKSQSAAELFKVAAALREKAEFAVASVRDEAKRLMIAEDARKPKPTTEPGRLLRRAEHAEARADAEARREAERAAKAAEKARKEAARVAEKAAKEEALAEEKARKEAARVAEKAEKERALAEEKARKEAEKEKAALARRAAEEARIAEKAEKEAARVAEKARREAERVAEKARKEAEKEAARLARETALAEAEKEKEAARAARESALAEAKARREAASDAERAAREAEKRRLHALRSETELELTNDLVRFLLKHPRSNRDAVVNAFVDSKRQELPEEKREYATKAFVRARVALVAEAPANPNDPLRFWRITAFGLEAAGLTSDEAEALRPKVELTSEERALVEKKKREAARKAEEEKKEANAKKQASVLKGFFAAAPKRALVPEPAVFAAPKPLALDENAERAFVEAVSNGGGGACGSSGTSDFLRRWKAARRTDQNEASRSATRWGARRGAKRNRDAGETNAENADAATRLAIERSLADVDASASRDGFSSFANVAADPPLNAAKRRKLISVDCSSEYRDEQSEDGRETILQYRFGFQLGLEQLDSPSELRKTFPVPGGRPAFWGSWGASRAAPFVDGTSKAVKEGDTERREVTGRRPFARDARVAYLDDAGALFDSGDEWDEPEDGERLDGSDVDDEDDECAPRSDETDDDEQTEGFVVPDGYLSAEENVCGAEELADDEMDVDDVSDDDQDARGLRRSPENEFSEDEAREAAETKRARAQLTQWMDRARRQNKPLVIASFAEYAEDSSKSSSKDDPATPEPKTSDQNAHLLAALASSRFRRAGGPASQHARGPAVRLYAPPPSAEELCAADAARVAEERRLKEEERARLAAAKAEEKRRREEERERLRLAREAAAAAAADKRARKEEERLAKKAEKEAAKAEKAAAKAEKERLKAEKESLKAAKAAAKAEKGGGVASTPAKTSLDGAVGAEARVAKVSPIKSLFERAAAANLKSAPPGGSIAAAPEGEDGKQ
jgi:hypothetical protein